MDEHKQTKKTNALIQGGPINLKATQRHPFMLPDEAEQNSDDDNQNFENHFSELTRAI